MDPPNRHGLYLGIQEQAALGSSCSKGEAITQGLRPCNPIVSAGTTKFGMVEDTPPTQRQPAYSPNVTGDVFRDQCFQDRGGAVCRNTKSEDLLGGPVVQKGVHSSHKLVGAEGCFPCCSVLCKTAVQLPHSDILGQPGGSGLYKQDGRNTLPKALRSCSGNVGVVHREEVDSPCGTPAQEVQCYSRFQIETPQRFQRLATQSPSVQGTRSSLWSNDSGSLCILQKHTTDNFLQLETRPQGEMHLHNPGFIINHTCSLLLP